MKKCAFFALVCLAFSLFSCAGPSVLSSQTALASSASSSIATTVSSVSSENASSSISNIEQSSASSSSAVSSQVSSVNSSSKVSSSAAQPTMAGIISKAGQSVTVKGIVRAIKADGFILALSSGYAYIKNPASTQGLKKRILQAVSMDPQEGNYVQVTGNVSVESGYLEIDVPIADDITILTNETPDFEIPLPRTMTAIELSDYLEETYIEWISGDDRPSTRAKIPFVPEEITCTELRVFLKDQYGSCQALGPGLVGLDFDASFADDGYNLETAPYQLTFYVLDFATTTCTLSLTGSKKLTPEFPYTTIADLKNNPVRAAHYNIQGEIMGDAYGQYVVDDGTGRIYVTDYHLAGTYGAANQEVGKKVSIDGVLCQAFFERHYELMSYSFSTEITHTPNVSLNTVASGFPSDEYKIATDEATTYWISPRFSCQLTYKSGGLPDDPTLRCTHDSSFCVIINYEALGMAGYPASFAFTGYLVYGYKNVASLLYDGHTEA